ncbi:MAG: prolipoprotein diacylglyceryl transferase [Acidimicrobiia bacterium]|nr:prolipoprotein diacylglyceryl transferase [Acidimicrobiia bacterium]
MRPIPILFHIGPFTVHTYGIGLAITFVFAAWYLARRLRTRGVATEWLSNVAVGIIVAAIVGARLVHVASHLTYYTGHPLEIVMIWRGGLSSFGGLAAGLAAGIFLARTRRPMGTNLLWLLDVAAPVLACSWAIGRLLGPQLMINGGGHPTTAWYGLSYAGQVGKRIPVPIFQAVLDFAIFGVLLLAERHWGRRPLGAIFALWLALWGVARFAEEYFWLATPSLWDAVEVFSVMLTVAATTALVVLRRRDVSSTEGRSFATPSSASNAAWR